MIEVDGPRHCIDEAARALAEAARVDGAAGRGSRRDRRGDRPAVADPQGPVAGVAQCRTEEDQRGRRRAGVAHARADRRTRGPGREASHHHRQFRPRGQRQHPCEPAGGSRRSGADDAARRPASTRPSTWSCGSAAPCRASTASGLEKRDFVAREIDPVTLDLMRRIKAAVRPQRHPQSVQDAATGLTGRPAPTLTGSAIPVLCSGYRPASMPARTTKK